MEDNKKETLMSVLLTGDEEKIKKYLLLNGKKKSYCPIYFKPKSNGNDDNKLQLDELTCN